jgi:hypothetical protein
MIPPELDAAVTVEQKALPRKLAWQITVLVRFKRFHHPLPEEGVGDKNCYFDGPRKVSAVEQIRRRPIL